MVSPGHAQGPTDTRHCPAQVSCVRGKCLLRATGGGRCLHPRQAGVPRRPSAPSGPRAVDSEYLLSPSPSSQAAGHGEAGASVCGGMWEPNPPGLSGGQRGWAAHPSPRHLEVELAVVAWAAGTESSCSWRTRARGGRLVSRTRRTHSPLPPAPCRQPHHRATHVGPRQGHRFHGKQAAFSVRAVPPAPPSKQFQQPLQRQRTSKPPA